MSNSQLIAQLLDRFDNELLSPQDRWDIGKRAERLAEELGDARLLYEVRMRLVGIAHEVADAESQLSLFLWCAYTHDSNPSRFPARPIAHIPDIDILWWYKWLTGMLFAFPQYSLTQIDSALDMMRGAYRREGAGNAGILWAELQRAMEAGSEEDAREALARIKTAPVDEYSNCDACSRAAEVSLLFSFKDDDAALTLFDEILANHFTCGEEPESIISEVLIHLLRTGRTEQAVALQERSYPRIMTSPAHLTLQAEHMLFFIVTGNPATAFNLFVRHIQNLWHEGLSPAARLGALTRLIRVARGIEESGHGHLPIAGTESAEARAMLGHGGVGTHCPPLTISEFVPRAHAVAAELAEKFDTRNGHKRSAEALAEAMEAPEVAYPIDLGGTEFRNELPNTAEYLVVGLDLEHASAKQWLELAIELDAMEGVTGAGTAFDNALKRTQNARERETFLSIALLSPRAPHFRANFEEFVGYKRSRGQDECVRLLTTYDWKLWRAVEPEGEAPEAGIPDPDLVAEFLRAKWVPSRLVLGRCLTTKLANDATETFKRWDSLGMDDPQVIAEMEAWDTPHAIQVAQRAFTAADELVPQLADALHGEICATIERGEELTWPIMMAYTVLQARAFELQEALVTITRVLSDGFSVTPPPLKTITMLLGYQAKTAREQGAVGSELMSLWGLTTMAIVWGTERELWWDERISELAGEARHPYLAARLYFDGAVAAFNNGDLATAIDLARLSVSIIDSVEHLRPLMHETVKRYIDRSVFAETLFKYLLADGQNVEAYSLGRDLLEKTHRDTNAFYRESRIVWISSKLAEIMLVSDFGDLYEAGVLLDSAIAHVDAARKQNDPDEAALVESDVLVLKALFHVMAGELENAVACAHEITSRLEPLNADFNDEANRRLAALVNVMFRAEPTVALEAMQLMRDKGFSES